MAKYDALCYRFALLYVCVVYSDIRVCKTYVLCLYVQDMFSVLRWNKLCHVSERILLQ
jgi:hypothetical protein